MPQTAEETRAGESRSIKQPRAIASRLAWWSRLTLQKQLAILIIAFVVVVEGSSITAAYIQLQRAHEASVENAALAFVRETLETLTSAEPEERPAIAQSLSFGGRSIKVGQLALAASWIHPHGHDDIAHGLHASLLEQGFPIEKVIDGDWQVRPVRPLGQWLDRVAASQDVPRGRTAEEMRSKLRTLVLVAVKLEGDTDWFNYFFLLPAINYQLVLRNAVNDGILAVVLTIPLILLVGHVMRPFKSLAYNADRIGRGETVTAIAASGSADVRSTVDAFNRMGSRIELARDYRSAMLRSLAHDLKGPLGSAIRITKTLEDEENSDRILRYLESGKDTVDSITSFAHAINRDGDLAVVDLPSLIEALVDDQIDAGHTGTVRIETPITLEGRRNTLSRALQNIIENAAKYGGAFSVELKREGGNAIIHVEDDGPGIDPDKFETVFRPFERLSRDTPGSGLGLSIAKAIVVDHGGTIELENRASQGLRVTVTLPLDPSQA